MKEPRCIFFRFLVIGITQQTRRRGAQCAPALAEQASFAGANDPNAGRMGAVPNLPPANCPPMADRAHTVRPYGRFDLLLPQFDVAFSRSAEESRSPEPRFVKEKHLRRGGRLPRPAICFSAAAARLRGYGAKRFLRTKDPSLPAQGRIFWFREVFEELKLSCCGSS